MSYVIAWSLVYSVCIKGTSLVCDVHQIQWIQTERDCMALKKKQDDYFKKVKIEASIYCIKSSKPLRLKGE